MKTVCRPFSHPGGTCAGADADPALKRRAIVGCPVGTNAVPKSFCNGRLGQLAFEFHAIKSVNVKIKNIIALVTIVWMLSLVGCKPKTTPSSLPPPTPQPKSIPPAITQPKMVLSGQMFIVTEGAENVKLGDIEVLLIETTQATNFLQKKQSAIETLIQSRKQALEIADANAREPQAEYELVTKMITTMNAAIENADKDKDMPRTAVENDLAVTEDDLSNFNLYFTNSPYIMNNDFVAVKRNGGQRLTWIVQLAKTWSTSPIYLDANRTTIENDMSAIIPLKQELNEIARTTREKYDLANSSLTLAKIKLEMSPTPEDYLADFLPTFIQKTITDADGKFSFIYPIEKPLTIFAHAQRMVGTKTEQYYWLINAPTNAESMPVFLSNHNLVTVDPDGYFKIKPIVSSEEK